MHLEGRLTDCRPCVATGGGGRAKAGAVSNAAPDRPTVADSLLIKQRNKLQKALADIAQLEKRQRAQEALDAGQRAKLGRKADLEEALRQVIPTPSHFSGPVSPIFPPVSPRLLRVFTVSTTRFQRAPSRNPGPRHSQQEGQEGRTEG